LPKPKIRVLNPVSGRRTFIARKAAEKYVARGRARWRGDAVFFVESYARDAAEKSAAVETQCGYDRVGLMTMDQVAGLPMLGDVVKLFTRA
jgi:hypothetical protein